jgi:hypothetical protein
VGEREKERDKGKRVKENEIEKKGEREKEATNHMRISQQKTTNTNIT